MRATRGLLRGMNALKPYPHIHLLAALWVLLGKIWERFEWLHRENCCANARQSSIGIRHWIDVTFLHRKWVAKSLKLSHQNILFQFEGPSIVLLSQNHYVSLSVCAHFFDWAFCYKNSSQSGSIRMHKLEAYDYKFLNRLFLLIYIVCVCDILHAHFPVLAPNHPQRNGRTK